MNAPTSMKSGSIAAADSMLEGDLLRLQVSLEVCSVHEG